MDLTKIFAPNVWLSFLPMILLSIGSWLKGKDANLTGIDDSAGNILIALAPVLIALASSNETAFKKALRAARDTINNYLGD